MICRIRQAILGKEIKVINFTEFQVECVYPPFDEWLKEKDPNLVENSNQFDSPFTAPKTQ